MLVHEFLTRSARRLPEKVALVCGERRLTYRELDCMSNRLAQALAEGGVERGDRVALHLHNTVEAVVGIFAVLKAGGVFVPVNASTKPDKLAYILNNCRAKALLIEARNLEAMNAWETVPSLALAVVCGPKGDAADARIRSFDAIQSE